MPLTLAWQSIVVRIVLTAVAAGIIGLDRDERGHSAGLRTNLLVALAACFAMIQTNALIISTGKSSDSFVVMDIMRLPLGILSGIGFIGAGAIIKRGKMIVGLTTAATLWFVTVMGLCFGGGQIAIGLAAFAMGYAVLAGLKKVEWEMLRHLTATLSVYLAPGGPDESEIKSLLERAGMSATSSSLSYDAGPDEVRMIGWNIRWKADNDEAGTPPVIRELTANPNVLRVEFKR
jgi:putative Mg2+ transporter-C (MgtC) family protein